MTIKSKQKKKSLCEKSVHLVKNIIKLSSLSLASMNLRKTGSLPNKNIATRPSPTLSIDVSPVSYPRANQRSQKPEQNKSTPQSYLLDGSDGGESSSKYIVIQGNIDNYDNGRFHDNTKKFHERNRHEVSAPTTNLRASNYIRRFHEKNKVDSTTSDHSEDLPFILPPPPIIKLVRSPRM